MYNREHLFLKTDGASKGNPGPSSIGYVIYDSYGRIVDKSHKAIGHSTSNMAEYLALLEGIRHAKSLGASHLDCQSDSQVLVGHTNSQYNVKDPNLVSIMHSIRKEIEPLSHFYISHISRNYNREADHEASLSFIAKKRLEQEMQDLPPNQFISFTQHPGITLKED